MIQVSMVGYATAGAFLGLSYFDLYYHLIAITVLTWSFIRNQETPASTTTKAMTAIKPFSRRAVARTN